MATRGVYRFKEMGKAGVIHKVYNHWDNYPSNAYILIKNTLRLAWPLPRFEADEFACAFIAANKDQAGGMRLMPHDQEDMGQDYNYLISFELNEGATGFYPDGKLIISFDDYNNSGKITFRGTLEEMEKYIKDKDE